MLMLTYFKALLAEYMAIIANALNIEHTYVYNLILHMSV